MSKTKAASPEAISRTEVKAPGHLHLGELCPHYGGVCAFGDTPDAASRKFDLVWSGGKP